MILDFGSMLCEGVDSTDPAEQYRVTAKTESTVQIFIHFNSWSFDRD
jgi:hypothetical protein